MAFSDVALTMSSELTTNSFIEAASRTNKLIFVIYVIVLIISAVLAVLLYRSGTRVQDAIKADADARIRLSDEKIASLNTEAESFKADAERAREGIAKSEADTAKANERAEALALEAVKQRQRTAKFEKEVLILQARLSFRRLTPAQHTALIEMLSQSTKGSITVRCVGGSSEPCTFAEDIVKALQASGWTIVEFIKGTRPVGAVTSGLEVRAQNLQIPRAVALQRALERIGLSAPGRVYEQFPGDTVELFVGTKP